MCKSFSKCLGLEPVAGVEVQEAPLSIANPEADIYLQLSTVIVVSVAVYSLWTLFESTRDNRPKQD
jgi:hypothetical protein